MEGYRLKSTVAIDEREFLIQTISDEEKKAVVSSLFVDGTVLEVSQYPHPEHWTDEDVQHLVKTAHSEKKTEIEHLLDTYRKVAASGDAEIIFNVGMALFYKRLYGEAKGLFESVLTCRPEHHQAGNYLGLTFLALRKYDEAVQVLARVVELKPDFADYHNNYGEALLEAGFCRRAAEEFEMALKRNIYYADAYFNRGVAYLANAATREDFQMYANYQKTARDSFDKAALISPEYKTSRYAEACLLLDRGETARSLPLFKAVRDARRDKCRQDFSSFYLRFLLYSDRSNEKVVSERIAFLAGEIARNPNYSDLHHELGLCYLHQAQSIWAKGIDQFRRALEINRRLDKSSMAADRAEEFLTDMKRTVISIAKGDGD